MVNTKEMIVETPLCGVCGQTFSTDAELREHKVIHNREKPFECSFCDMRYVRYHDFQNHLSTLHSRRSFRLKIGEIVYWRAVENVSEMDPGNEMYRCVFCSDAFMEQHHLLEHFRQHITDMYKCEGCGKRFTHTEDLHSHMKRIHRGIPNPKKKSDMPDRSNETGADDNGDAQMPSDADPIVSAQIIKFTDEGSILLMEKNDDENVDDLYEGPGSEVYASNIVDKSVQCDLCNKTFGNKHNLQEHMLTHTGEKPFACAICDVRYRQRSAVSRHVKSAHKDYQGHTFQAIRKVSASDAAAPPPPTNPVTNTPANTNIGQGPSGGARVKKEKAPKKPKAPGSRGQQHGNILARTGGFVAPVTKPVTNPQVFPQQTSGRPAINAGGGMLPASSWSVTETGQFVNVANTNPGPLVPNSSSGIGRVVAAGSSVPLMNPGGLMQTGSVSVVGPQIPSGNAPVVNPGSVMHGARSVSVVSPHDKPVVGQSGSFIPSGGDYSMGSTGSGRYVSHGNAAVAFGNSGVSVRPEETGILVAAANVCEDTVMPEMGHDDDDCMDNVELGSVGQGHTSEMPQCKVCNKTFSYQSLLQEHMLIHAGENPYACLVCEMRFTQRDTVERHMRTAHKGHLEDNAVSKPSNPTNKPSNSNSIPTNPRATSSIRNGFTFTRGVFEKKDKVVKLIEPDKPGEVATKAKTWPQSRRTEPKGDKTGNCPICGKFFRISLRQHIKTHSGEKPYICYICNKGFAAKFYLRQHIGRIHRGRVPEVEIDEALSRLREKPEVLKPFTCEICGNRFAEYRYLRDHTYRIHTTDLPVPKVPKGLSSEEAVKIAVELYNKIGPPVEKPFTCDRCGSQFSNKNYLKSHIQRVHNKNQYVRKPKSKPIQKKADKRANYSAFLNIKEEDEADDSVPGKRIRKKRKYFAVECPICKKKLYHKSYLQYHIIQHTGETPYKCDVCDKRFRNPNTFRFHRKNAHRCPIHDTDSASHEPTGNDGTEETQNDASVSKSDEGEIVDNSASVSKSDEGEIVDNSTKSGTDDVPVDGKSKDKTELKCTCKFALKDFEHQLCTYCGEEFPDRKLLLKHMASHTESEPYKCEYCGMGFSLIFSRSLHITNEHKDEASGSKDAHKQKRIRKRKDVEKQPRKRSTRKSSVKNRKRKVRNGTEKRTRTRRRRKYTESDGENFSEDEFDKSDTETVTSTKPFQCEYCEFTCKLSSALDKHVRRKHRGTQVSEKRFVRRKGYVFLGNPEDDPDRDMTNDQDRANGDGHISSEEELEETDTETPTSTKPFQCEYCEFTCKSSSTLDKHVSRKHFTRRKGYVFLGNPEDDPDQDKTNDQDKTKSNSSESNGDKIKCKVCSRTYDNKYFKEHMRLHTGEKLFQCVYCDMTFCFQTSVCRHLRTVHKEHQEDARGTELLKKRKTRVQRPTLPGRIERPTKISYECTVCCLIFSRKEDFDSHIAYHDSHEVYACRFCNMKFKHAISKNMHESAWHKESAFTGSSHSRPILESLLTAVDTYSEEILLRDVKVKLSKCDSDGDKGVVVVGGDSPVVVMERDGVDNDGDVCNTMEWDGDDNVSTKVERDDNDDEVRNNTKTNDDNGQEADSNVPEGCAGNESGTESRKDCVTQLFQCTVCDKILSDQHLLHEHMKVHRGDNSPDTKGSKAVEGSRVEKIALGDKCVGMRMNFDINLKTEPEDAEESDDEYTERNKEGESSKTATIHEVFQKPEMYKVFRCKLCSEIFSYRNLLAVHLTERHGDRVQNIEEGDLNCNFCSVGFNDRESFRNHVLDNHAMQVIVDDDGDDEDARDSEVVFAGDSGPSLKHESEVEGGQDNTNTEPGVDTSNNVAEGMNSDETLQSTKVVRRGVSYFCTICCKFFTQKFPFLEHIRKHTGEKPFRCEICHKNFRYDRSFKKHLHDAHPNHESGKDQSATKSLSTNEESGALSQKDGTESESEQRGDRVECEKGESGNGVAASSNNESGHGSRLKSRRSKHVNEGNSETKVTIKGSVVLSKGEDGTLTFKHTIDEKSRKASYFCEICDKTFKHQRLFHEHAKLHTGLNPYKCDYCDLSFTQERRCINHMQSAHAEMFNMEGDEETSKRSLYNKKYQCEVCLRWCASQSKLTEHLRIHTGDKPHQCEHCQRKFRHFGTFKKHVRSSHPGRPVPSRRREKRSKGKPYQCSVCQVGCKSQGQLTEHMTIHTGEKPHECVYCKRSFRLFRVYKRHVQSVHKDLPLPSNISSDSYVKSDVESGTETQNLSDDGSERDESSEYPHHCSICNKGCKTPSGLRLHMLAHDSSKLYQCDYCDRSFSLFCTYRRHIRALHKDRPLPQLEWKPKERRPKVYQEEEGSDDDDTSKPVRGRKKKDPKVYRYKCSICGLSCRSPATLRKHMLTHTGERPHPCDYCSARFRQFTCLIKHVEKLHEGCPRPKWKSIYHGRYKCTLCGLGRLAISKLGTHMLYHTGQTPHKCPHCDLGYRYFQRLQRHIRNRHEGCQVPTEYGDVSYFCGLCETTFKQVTDYGRHLATEHKEYAVRDNGSKDMPSTDLEASENDEGNDTKASENDEDNATKASENDESKDMKVRRRCLVCKKECMTHAELREHMVSHTMDGSRLYVSQTRVRKNDDESGTTKVYRHRCPICDKACPSPAAVRDHITIHSGVRPYECMYCSRPFRLFRVYKTHVIKKHKGQPLPVKPTERDGASEYEAAFPSDEGFLDMSAQEREALKTQNAGDGYRCQYCSKKFTQVRPFQEHVRTHTGDRPYKCKFCPMSFNYRRNVLRHIRNVHMWRSRLAKTRSTDPKLYELIEEEDCDQDDLSFIILDESQIPPENEILETDNEGTGGDFDESTEHPPPSDGKRKKTSANDGGIWKCRLCREVFRSKESLRKHMIRHNGKKPYKCILCEKRFNFQGAAARHVRMIHKGGNGMNIGKGKRPEAYKCSVCDETFTSFGLRYRHEKKVHPECATEKPQSSSMCLCSVCGHMCRNGYKLKLHMLKHTDERPHECEYCHLKFKLRSSLKNHLQLRDVHGSCQPKEKNDKNMFKCPICEKVLYPGANQIRIEEHMRLHTGATPFKCDFCHVRFRYESSIKQHLKTRELRGACPRSYVYSSKEKRFSCTICNKGFVSKRSLVDHMTIHTGEKRYVCDYCPAKYRCATTLRIHLKNVHKGFPSRVTFKRPGEIKPIVQENIAHHQFSSSHVDNTNRLPDNTNNSEQQYPVIEQPSYEDAEDEAPDLWTQTDDDNGHLYNVPEKPSNNFPVSQDPAVRGENTYIQLASQNLGASVARENTFVHIPISQGFVSNPTNAYVQLPVNQNQDTATNLTMRGENTYNLHQLPVGQTTTTNTTMTQDNTYIQLPTGQTHAVNPPMIRDYSYSHLPGSQIPVANYSMPRESTYVHVPVNQNPATNPSMPRDTPLFVPLPLSHDPATNSNQTMIRDYTINPLSANQVTATSTTIVRENTFAQMAVSQDNSSSNIKIENANTSSSAKQDGSKVKKTPKKRKSSYIPVPDDVYGKIKRKQPKPEDYEKCTFCNKDFLKNNLAEHMRIHTGEKPHHCHLCEEKYRHRSALLRHFKTAHQLFRQREVVYGDKNAGKVSDAELYHKGKRKGGGPRTATVYQCKFCDRKYTGKNGFQEHVRSHTGEVPYQCNFCHVRYRYLASIRRHLKMKELRGVCPTPHKNLVTEKVIDDGKSKISRLFQCRLCGHPFSLRVHYNEHMKMHAGESRLKCVMCGQHFDSSEELRDHVTSTHVQEIDDNDEFDEDDPGVLLGDTEAGDCDVSQSSNVSVSSSNNEMSVSESVAAGGASTSTSGGPMQHQTNENDNDKDYSVIAVIDMMDFESGNQQPTQSQNQSRMSGTEHCVTDLKQL